jgi:hypothetical protein
MDNAPAYLIWLWIGLSYGAKRHFQQYVSYIAEVSFIGDGENHSHFVFKRPTATQEKPITAAWQLQIWSFL